MIYDKFVQDPDWKTLVICKQKFTPTKEWAEMATALLKDKLDSNAYFILLYDAITHEVMKIEDRIKGEQNEENQRLREEYRRKTHNT